MADMARVLQAGTLRLGHPHCRMCAALLASANLLPFEPDISSGGGHVFVWECSVDSPSSVIVV